MVVGLWTGLHQIITMDPRSGICGLESVVPKNHHVCIPYRHSKPLLMRPPSSQKKLRYKMRYRRESPNMVAEQENLRLSLDNLPGDVYHLLRKCVLTGANDLC